MNYDKLDDNIKRALRDYLSPMDEELLRQRINNCCPFEVMDMFLTWHGIINYTHTILNAIDSIHEANRGDLQ